MSPEKRRRCTIRLSASFLGLGLFVGGCSSRPPAGTAPDATSRAIRFLQREVPAWSRENGCFSCHNNGDAARALYAALKRGHDVERPALDDTSAWVSHPESWEHNQGDPGFSDQRLADLQFAASLLAAIESGRLKDRRPLEQAVRKVAAHQDADGAWPVEPQNPVGSPATWGTALATFMAWQTLVRAGRPETAAAVQKAEQWLRRARPVNAPAAAVTLLAFAERERDSDECALALNYLRSAQTSDGGWGPFKDSPPETFDTALALLALAEAKGEPTVPELIERGRAFLQRTQREDGSWPATTRPSGGASYAQRMSTTGWATLALLKTRR